MSYLKNLAIAIDQLVNTICGGSPDETISAVCYRRGWWLAEDFINAIFFDKDHCLNAFLSEQNRKQLPKEYRNASV